MEKRLSCQQSKSQGLYDPTPNTNDPIQRNKQKPCSTVSQAQNQVQRHPTTSNITALPPVNTIFTTDQARPLFLNTRETDVHKTDSNDGHGKTDFTPAHDKRQDMLPHSTPPHDDSHIHRASPIRGLPPEPLANTITVTAKQQRLKGVNSSQTTARPNTSDLPTNPTARAIARNDRIRLRQGKRSHRSTQLSIQHRRAEEDCNYAPKPQDQLQLRRRLTPRNKVHATDLEANRLKNKYQVTKTNITKSTISSQADIWGHEIGPKEPNTIRLLLQNTGGIDHKPGGSVKLAALYAFMQEAQVDIAALTECNTAWDKIDYSLSLAQQTKYWWENAHWSVSHNRQDPHSAPYQPGGTSIVVVNQLSHRAQRPGDNTVGLGRWCWARLRGKNNRFLRVASVYRPCPGNGPLSTYQQQIRFWSGKKMDCCPRVKILADLKEEVVKWQADGDHVMILADMNDDVNTPALIQFCQDLNMVEAISTLHGPAQKPTHQRGRLAIDGIYIS